MEGNNLVSLTVKELRTITKQHELKGYSKLNKARLANFIRENSIQSQNLKLYLMYKKENE